MNFATSAPHEKEPLAGPGERLPRRDYILLPLISLITIIAMIAAAETVSRVIWPDYTLDPCSLPGGHYKPNCSVKQKTMEGPSYLLSFNECGYRTLAPCGPKPSGHIRAALLGSSFALGFGVPYEDTFAVKTEQQLSRACRRPVEIQNLGAEALQPLQVYRRVDEALALQPDLLIITINPADAVTDYTDREISDRDQPSALERKVVPLSRLAQLSREVSDQFTFIQVLQHFRYLNKNDYIQHFLSYGDQVDYLRPPMSEAWRRRFAQLDLLMGEMADKAHQRGVPLIFISGLNRIQAGLLNEPNFRPGIDPYAFEREFAEIAARHDIVNIDPNSEFSHLPNAINLFYPVNGHLTEEGNSVFEQALVRGLLSSDLAVFRGCSLAHGSAR